MRKLIFKKLQEIIAEQFSVDESSITMDTSFVDDLGADSLDIAELSMAFEEEFDIPEADDNELIELHTVGDVVSYISKFVD